MLRTIGSDEDFERIERLRDDLRHVRKRWDDRLILENCPLWEGYLNGDFEIALYGDAFIWGDQKIMWVVRVPAKINAIKNASQNSESWCLDLTEGGNGDEIIMFVVVAQTGGGPKVKVRIPARFYFFRDEFCGVGEGLLYRGEGLGAFKVFPFFREGKVELAFRADTERRSVNPDIQTFPKIIHRIAHNCAKVLRDRFFGGEGDLITIGFPKGCYTPMNHPKIIHSRGEGRLIPNDLINVAIGPLDL